MVGDSDSHRRVVRDDNLLDKREVLVFVWVENWGLLLCLLCENGLWISTSQAGIYGEQLTRPRCDSPEDKRGQNSDSCCNDLSGER